MSIYTRGTDLVLVQGLSEAGSPGSRRATQSRKRRYSEINRHGPGLGVIDYKWVDGHGRRVANRLLRRMRKTAVPPDAVEIMAIDDGGLRESLACEAGRARWRELLGCEPGVYNRDSSFILMGRPRIHLEGNGSGQRLLWFGNGLDHLSRAEFIAHYTACHGPLVAGHAQLIGMRSYRQVPDEEDAYCESLRELGLGAATPPAVFGELVMGAPAFSLTTLRDRRAAAREIEADEKRHINFGKSMLLLTGRE